MVRMISEIMIRMKKLRELKNEVDKACVNVVYQFFVELNSENMEIFLTEILAGF